MPAPRLKREISEPQKDVARTEDPLIPALLTSVAQEVCAAMHASGALIAAVDSQGIRCVASAGNAPAPGSRLEPDGGLTAECLKSGEVVFRENVTRTSRGSVSSNARPSFHSAVAIPILAEGLTVGAIEVFSSRASGIYKADIAPLAGIADFLAPILAPASVYEAKRASVASTLGADQAKTGSASEKDLTAVNNTVDPADAVAAASEQEPVPSTDPGIIKPLVDRMAVLRAWSISSVRLTHQWCASKMVSARAGTASLAATMVRHVAQNTTSKRLLATAVILLAAALMFVGFHARFLKSPDTTAQREGNEPRLAPAPKAEEINPRQDPGTQPPKALSDSSTSVTQLAPQSQSSAGSQTAATQANVAPANPTAPNPPQQVGTESAARPVFVPTESKPVAPADIQKSGSLAPSMPAETNTEMPELQMAPAQLPVLAVTPAIPAAIEAVITSRPAFVLDRTFKGHSSWVTSVVFSLDGRRLASGSWDQTVKFWDVPSGNELDTLGRKMKEVQALALSRDGHWLAAENSSDTVMLWDATTGTEVRTLPSNKPLGPLGTNFVYSIAFSPDGRWLASGVDEKTVRLWDVRTGQTVRDLTTARRSVIYAAFSPDGRWFASGDDDKSIRIWDASTGEEIRRLTGHRKPIYAVAFSPNGRLLASASADKTIKLWDVSEGREVHTLAGHGGSVTSLAFSPDGRWLASGSWDKTIKIWNVETGREVQTLSGGHDHSIYTVAFDSRGRWLASGSEDGSISLWRLGGALDRAKLQ